MINEANELKYKIKKDITEKYKDVLSALKNEKDELENKINEIKIQEAKNSWYPEGTIVELWSYGYKAELINTKKKGVVAIYDGSQIISDVNRHRRPKKGDLIIIHLNRNGTLGLRYDVILKSDIGKYFSTIARGEWIKEGEEPKPKQ